MRTKQHWILLVFLILFQFSLSGCMPYMQVIIPSVNGTVVDEKTKNPITGAIVSLLERPRIAASLKSSATTDDLGKFSIKQKATVAFLIFIGDPIPRFSTLEVKKEGYIDYSASVCIVNFREVHYLPEKEQHKASEEWAEVIVDIKEGLNLTIELETKDKQKQ